MTAFSATACHVFGVFRETVVRTPNSLISFITDLKAVVIAIPICCVCFVDRPNEGKLCNFGPEEDDLLVRNGSKILRIEVWI